MPSNGFRRFVSRSRRRKRVRRASRINAPAVRRIQSEALVPANGIREELVCRVRAEIHAGIYDTPEKFDLALERMLRRLDIE
jgi:hypothetical protein